MTTTEQRNATTEYIAPGQPSPSTWTAEQCAASTATRLAQRVCARLGVASRIAERHWYNLPDHSVMESMDYEATRSVRGYVLHADPIDAIRPYTHLIVDFLAGILPPFDGVLSDDRLDAAAAAMIAGSGADEVREAGQLWCRTGRRHVGT